MLLPVDDPGQRGTLAPGPSTLRPTEDGPGDGRCAQAFPRRRAETNDGHADSSSRVPDQAPPRPPSDRRTVRRDAGHVRGARRRRQRRGDGRRHAGRTPTMPSLRPPTHQRRRLATFNRTRPPGGSLRLSRPSTEIITTWRRGRLLRREDRGSSSRRNAPRVSPSLSSWRGSLTLEKGGDKGSVRAAAVRARNLSRIAAFMPQRD